MKEKKILIKSNVFEVDELEIGFSNIEKPESFMKNWQIYIHCQINAIDTAYKKFLKYCCFSLSSKSY